MPLVLSERSGGKGHRLSSACSLSEAKGERPKLRGVALFATSLLSDQLGKNVSLIPLPFPSLARSYSAGVGVVGVVGGVEGSGGPVWLPEGYPMPFHSYTKYRTSPGPAIAAAPTTLLTHRVSPTALALPTFRWRVGNYYITISSAPTTLLAHRVSPTALTLTALNKSHRTPPLLD